MNRTKESGLIREWLTSEIAELLRMDGREVDIHMPFNSLGLDSAKIMMLSGELGQRLQRTVSPTLFWEFATIHELASALESGSPKETAGTKEKGLHGGSMKREPIAIVGMGCRFPGAPGLNEYWELLAGGKDAAGAYPADRLKLVKQTVRREGGYIEGIDGFDYPFFNLSYREAIRMDPQHRMLLEVVWEAFEDAGIPPAEWANTAGGVFIGISGNDYGREDLLAEEPHIYSITGNALCIAANRVSYLYNLHGPSVAVDTACSSSLAAVHMACQSIWSGDSIHAVAGGVNLILSDGITTGLANAGMLAANDRCKTFDASADGYVRGEGCGIVILKPMSKAVADGDDIYAVIHGGALNQDGRSNGLTAPNQSAQEALLRSAYRSAGISAASVRYVECHGTGTFLGDPIEVKALGSVLSAGRTQAEPLFLGAAKTNIGHLESAAGIAGLIKTALVLKHGVIPPNLHFNSWNGEIPHEEFVVRVPLQCERLPEGAFAGVSSFGFGGTNVHTVLGPGPVRVDGAQAAALGGRPELFALSARTKEGLTRLAERYLSFIRDGAERRYGLSLSGICAGLWNGRQHHVQRLAISASSFGELAEGLAAFLAGEELEGVKAGSAASGDPECVFYFTGEAAGQVEEEELLEFPVFQQSLHIVSLLARMQGISGREDEARRPAVQTFAWQYAFAQQLREWGIKPAHAEGEGTGAIAADVINGTITLEKAVRLLVLDGDAAPGEAGGESAGGIADECAGEFAGGTAGEFAGGTAGGIAGEFAGEFAGGTAGGTVGESVGKIAGESAGEIAGKTAGITSGKLVGAIDQTFARGDARIRIRIGARSPANMDTDRQVRGRGPSGHDASGIGRTRKALLAAAGECYLSGFLAEPYSGSGKGRTHLLPVYAWHHPSCWKQMEQTQPHSFQCFC
ncbi:hypothetical protein KP806_22610 [Paenibacillus sp. N4]|uniref:type I polyketide synthase n=1 Tax=Paenibacillus vietnamensis TaxID=2590547 RepID=UPI001CD15622|nr:beta-ketoacyl synthase N-terminal-like domain-containing protein [Paenibacillus vietnamensis]MCA0757858.1 hypothetical protein [Paenibacillus vietnamensis]